jgi:hypothetical protein
LSSDFLDRVARHILSCHAQDLPDLRGATILLPNYHVAQPLAQALSAAANLPALLLPQMVILNDWAQPIRLDIPIQPDTQRITALYQALRERRWFADADLWSMSRELLGLMDGLTRHHVALPESAVEFSKQLADAYRAQIVDATTESFVFEITGKPSKIDSFIAIMVPLGLIEVVRTGLAAISRGPEGM